MLPPPRTVQRSKAKHAAIRIGYCVACNAVGLQRGRMRFRTQVRRGYVAWASRLMQQSQYRLSLLLIERGDLPIGAVLLRGVAPRPPAPSLAIRISPEGRKGSGTDSQFDTDDTKM